MRRGSVLGMLLAVGALAAVKAQPPTSDVKRVIEVEKVKDNLWVLRGKDSAGVDGGGNTAVFATANGVTVIDAKNPGWGKPILDKIKELTPKPVTMLINTHTHGDHVSGNVEFPATVDIVVQENTKTNMEKMPIFKEHNGRYGEADLQGQDDNRERRRSGRPVLLRTRPHERRRMGGVSRAPYRSRRRHLCEEGVPLIDEANGGSMLHISETLMKAHDGIKNVDTIINGHMPAQTTWADLKEYADFNKDLVTWMQTELKAGKTPEQAATEWKIPEKYKGYSPTVSELFGGLPGRIKVLQNEMKK